MVLRPFFTRRSKLPLAILLLGLANDEMLSPEALGWTKKYFLTALHHDNAI